MRSLFLGCLILLAAATTGQAQLSDAQIVSRLRDQPGAPQQRGQACANKPVHVAVGVVGGAVAGWFGFLFLGLGIFASDHGEVYQRSRNQWMLGGALLFGGVALYQVVTTDCLVLPRRHPRDP